MMGEIADMMINGTLDCETGEYLGDGPGYPRTSRSFGRDPYAYAYDDEPRKPKRKMGRATRNRFANMYRDWCKGKRKFEGCKTGATGSFWALVHRDLIERIGQTDSYQFTKDGLAEAKRLFAPGGSSNT